MSKPVFAALAASVALTACGPFDTPKGPDGPIVAKGPTKAITPQQLYARRLADAIATRMGGKSVGYAVVAITPSGQQIEQSGGAARRAPDTNPMDMTGDTRLEVASVSKVFTGVALARILADRAAAGGYRFGLGSTATGFLPPAWTVDPSFKPTTFAELLRHEAGVRCPGLATYASARTCVATAVTPADKATRAYFGMNYALLRITFTRLLGAPPDQASLDQQEAAGNAGPAAASESKAYLDAVNKLVFKPAGIPYVHCKPTAPVDQRGLSYKPVNPATPVDFTTVGPGEDWGDMSLTCGYRGLNLTAREIAEAMYAIFQDGKIISAKTRQALIDNGPPFWPSNHGDGLTSLNHSGGHPAAGNKGALNTWVARYSNGLTVGVIINSDYNGSFVADLAQAIKDAGPIPQ